MNEEMLCNIQEINKMMHIHCNAGVASTNIVGELPGFGTVWYAPDGIAIILSLSKVKQVYRVTYDSDIDDKFIVHKLDGSVQEFLPSEDSLYYLPVQLQSHETAMVTMVQGQKE